MKTLRSKVMTIANRLVTQGYNRPHAMVKAWALCKLSRLETKVAGVTYGNRQKAIAHLARYAPESITIRLEREQGNTHDRNAVRVIAAVCGKGSYHMGYLPGRWPHSSRRYWTLVRPWARCSAGCAAAGIPG